MAVNAETPTVSIVKLTHKFVEDALMVYLSQMGYKPVDVTLAVRDGWKIEADAAVEVVPSGHRTFNGLH